MLVDYGKHDTGFGGGVEIHLSGDEVATAIDAYLVSHGVIVRGPRTIQVNGELCETGRVFVDPSGFVVFEGKRFSGRMILPVASTGETVPCGTL